MDPIFVLEFCFEEDNQLFFFKLHYKLFLLSFIENFI
jgi:hypothetical protein